MIKIDIISGFLGAGKTTLIKKLLREKPADEKTAIIENEFGEISIDGALLKRGGIEIREISSGCICCTLTDNFEKSLAEVIKICNPDRVIIEPSGVAKLSDVLKNCNTVLKKGNARIEMCLTVVSVLNFQMYMQNWGEFFQNQIEQAKTIILSRTQQTDNRNVEIIVRNIRRINQKAAIITTPWDQLDAKTILFASENNGSVSLTAQMEKENDHLCNSGHCHNHDHAHDASGFFDAWGVESPKVYCKQDIQKALRELSNQKFGRVIRAKGIVPLEDGNWMQFDYVTGEIEMTPIEPDYTGRLCVIGSGLNKQALEKLFAVA